MGSMKRLALLFSCSAALVCAADLSNVHTVYLLKMAKGLDQFLASRLTADHVFQVVTDPKLADAVFTDQIGEGFEMKLEELFPPPESREAGAAPKPEKTEDEANPLLGDTVNKLSNPAIEFVVRPRQGHRLPGGRQVAAGGLVGVPSLPKSGTPKDMDRTANDIVSRIKHDLKGK